MMSLTDAGHFYDLDGNPAYTIIGKNGKERNTNVKDAREKQLVPSVTTILNLLAKHGLEKWKSQQAILAALTLPRLPDESEQDWLDRVVVDSKATGRDAMNRGTEMHGQLEMFYLNIMQDYPSYVHRTDIVLTEHFGHIIWDSEKSFAHRLGYGGKCDLSSEKGIVVDFKTKESLEKAAVYDEHIYQLAAYREGLGMPDARCAIVFVSDTETQVHEIDDSKLTQGWNVFKKLVELYRIKNNL